MLYLAPNGFSPLGTFLSKRSISSLRSSIITTSLERDLVCESHRWSKILSIITAFRFLSASLAGIPNPQLEVLRNSEQRCSHKCCDSSIIVTVRCQIRTKSSYDLPAKRKEWTHFESILRN